MMLVYLIISVVFAAAILLAGGRTLTAMLNGAFYSFQAAFAVWIVCGGMNASQLEFFTFDATGILFFCLLAVISPVVCYHSIKYLDDETAAQKKLYYALLMLLCASMTCVYFANNAAVTWIFLEATTLCTAGLIYHRHTQRSLEATWKYIFVCSVGIAVAYLGILLLAGIPGNTGLGYGNLSEAVGNGNPLFMKLAFLFILTGYSCKMEVFPLYTIGIDANHAVPSPASALVSTALVNAGFVAIFRLYRVMENPAVFDWISPVLIIAGILSVLIGAVFMRRSGHYKRLMAYSTVENMGIVAEGLGVGGIGATAALIHMAGHSLLKSAMFLQIGRVGKMYGNYQVGRIGGYIRRDRAAGVIILVTAVLLLAFPPSPLFVSEIMIFRQIIMNGQWWLLITLVLLICTVIYNLGRHILQLCYQPIGGEEIPVKAKYGLMSSVFLLVAGAAVLGLWQPTWLAEWFNSMAKGI